MGGRAPSWFGETWPPGKTCAEAKEREVVTRWRRRMRFVGLMRRMDALGDGGEGGEGSGLDLGFGAEEEEGGDEEDEEDAVGPRMLRSRMSKEEEEGRSGIVRWG